MQLRRLIALILFVFSASAARAEEDRFCRNGLFPSDPPFLLAEVQGEDRAYFHGDMNGCPWTRGACSSPSYVVPGDKVLINSMHKGYACAFYPGKGGGTAGWVPLRQLRLVPFETEPAISAWLGAWSSEGNPELRFFEEDGRVHVVGEAWWPGPEPSEMYPSPHIGAIDGPVTLNGYLARYSDEDLCEVSFTLLGDLLIAGDNRQCGGMNVSFSAVYRRVTE
ncbi:MAG: hypothetical protein H6917_13265 [Novosphingobium sp.]|nr:hypothetical protein [Novosphingobium sp.]MCP5403339.1 hypothetical protein [Novosphingobium sp.]